ncbi:GDP-L-fucose synthase family protein [Candidatus Puniceispirillum sp.]|uniref:GDP-L-fucose synthase family protein n=1 Tax=Candidatus Puniceispirillum sp. TaxID=2026719 RepID=UPI003F69EE0A
MTENDKIFVAGHNGMVGSAIIRQLVDAGHGKDKIITRNRADLDLTNQADVRAFFEAEKPDQVYMAAARVGGIYANNTWPADFIYQNLMIEANVIDAAFRVGVKRLLFLGSSCIYPKLAPQPMQENALLSGALEPTNEPYAIAKIAGIKLCESYNRQYADSHGIDYRSVMPTNLYGPGDNYDPMGSHVVPALIRRFHEAKINSASEILIWGSGKQKREFLFVDDMALACIHIMNVDKQAYDESTEPMLSHINVGAGYDISIAELARTIAKLVGYKGDIKYDVSKPDGPPRKLIDSSLIQRLGWAPKIDLVDGLQRAFDDFLKQQ